MHKHVGAVFVLLLLALFAIVFIAPRIADLF